MIANSIINHQIVPRLMRGLVPFIVTDGMFKTFADNIILKKFTPSVINDLFEDVSVCALHCHTKDVTINTDDCLLSAGLRRSLLEFVAALNESVSPYSAHHIGRINSTITVDSFTNSTWELHGPLLIIIRELFLGIFSSEIFKSDTYQPLDYNIAEEASDMIMTSSKRSILLSLKNINQSSVGKSLAFEWTNAYSRRLSEKEL